MPTIQVLIDAKVAGLGEVGALDAEVNKLGSSTTTLGTNLDKTTGQLNIAGAAHGAAAKEAAILGADVEKAAGQVSVAGEAHVKAATATQGLGVQMEQAAGQAKSYGAEAESLGQKLSTLQGPSGLAGVQSAASGTSLALQDLAAADAKTTAATTTVSDAAQASTTAITNLAAVDANLGGTKKSTAAEIAKEAAQLEGAKAAHERHTESVLKGVKATGEFGEAGVRASEKLGSLSGILGGAGGISAGLAGVVVGAGAAIAIAKTATESYLTLGEAVLKYQHVTGASAEDSSRMVAVFGQLGLGSDTAANAMFTLDKRLEGLDGAATKSQKSLADVGVEVAKNQDGSTNLEKTLGNIADAYVNASGAADKDAIATVAFGKAGRDLLPILEQGSAGLAKMADQSQLVFDQQQLEAVHSYNVEMARSNQELQSVGMVIGGALVPVLADQAKVLNEAGESWHYATNHMHGMQMTGASTLGVFAGLLGKGADLAAQNRKNAEGNDAETISLQRLNQELKNEEQDRQSLLDADNQSTQAAFNMQHATQGVTNAQRALADETLKDAEYTHKHQASVDAISAAQGRFNEAVKAYGPASTQAKTAQDGLNKALDAGLTLDQQNAEAADRLTGAQLAVKEAMLQDSQAAVDLARKQAELTGGHFSARDAAAAQAGELQHLKDQAGGVLPAELQTLLDKLNGFVDHTATLHLRLDDQTGGMRGSFGTQIVSAAGGIFTQPTLTWVGESGPEAVVPLRAGNTMPGASPLPGAGSAMGSTYNVTQYITGTTDPVAAGNASAARLSQLLTSS
jgi:hypothetical protein